MIRSLYQNLELVALHLKKKNDSQIAEMQSMVSVGIDQPKGNCDEGLSVVDTCMTIYV